MIEEKGNTNGVLYIAQVFASLQVKVALIAPFIAPAVFDDPAVLVPAHKQYSLSGSFSAFAAKMSFAMF